MGVKFTFNQPDVSQLLFLENCRIFKSILELGTTFMKYVLDVIFDEEFKSEVIF